MRTSWIVITAAGLGCLTGVGLTYFEAASVGNRFEASYVNANPASGGSETPAAGRAVVVGESVYDFGTLQKEQTGTCTFKIRNESPVPLVVDLEGVSCGLCIATELSNAEVGAGNEFEFEVHYTTHKDGPEFSEFVEMRTNDPNHPVIRFNITGYVTRAIRFSKREIDFGSVSAGEDVSSDFRIYCYDEQPVKIVGHEFISQQTAGYFKLELTPLELDAFKDEEPRATSAVQARLSLARGNPLGPFRQVLHIAAEMGDKPIEAELTISGNIVSDIMLIGGSDFIKDKNLVQLRSILSTVGHSTTLRIRVHGPYRDQVQLKVGAIDPSESLTATIGERTRLKSGYLYPVKITVPKGAPSVNRLGSQQGKVGSIIIETTHPSAKQVLIYVSFAVE